MTALYVASDQEGAGKTALCATLVHMMRQRTRKAAAFKPLAGAGLTPESDHDRQSYRRLLGQPAARWPLGAADGSLTPSLLEATRATFDGESAEAELVLVEGSCGLSAQESRRVADALDAKVLMVVRYQRGLAAAELKSWQEAFGGRLVGFLLNGLTRYLGTEARARLLPSMQAEGLPCFGLIPEDRRLLAVSVEQLAAHLGGRFIVCEDKADALVEHLMVGGLSMDPAELYFGLRENKAVIVRSDRPDLQMAALATPTACMVLTGAKEPIEYVRYEAEQQEVSVMVVEAETLGAMDSLNTLMDRARFDHPLKLSRFAELLERHADLPRLLTAAGLEPLPS